MTPRPSLANGQVLVKAAALLQYSSASMSHSSRQCRTDAVFSLLFADIRQVRGATTDKKLQRVVSIETALREVLARITALNMIEHALRLEQTYLRPSGPNAGTSP